MTVQISARGRKIELRGDFDEFARHARLLSRHVDAEELVFACDHWRELDLGFILQFKRLKTLRLSAAWDYFEVPHLGALSRLEGLFLGQTARVDLAHLGGLRLKRLHFAAGAGNVKNLAAISRFRALEFLAVAGLRAPDFTLLRSLEKLKTLQVTGREVPSAAGLERLRALENVCLHTRLKRFDTTLAGLTKLRVLDLDWNPALADITALSGLRLTELSMWDAKFLRSLQPIGTIKTLRRLALGGRIGDGDIRPLLGLPALEFCALRGKRYFEKLLAPLALPKKCEWRLV